MHNSIISVIVPCYNHGRYLQEAIDSVRMQENVTTEIVVVDDGSSDNTKEVATANKGVKYVYQKNGGLSNARNTGIKHATGDYFLFLDADDWLLPGALQTNLKLLEAHPEAAFVSGGHEKVFTATGKKLVEDIVVTENHYQHLLQGNYIGMHATVLYRRWAFEHLRFDESLKACEDYDVYLKIARQHPVIHHTKLIAAYRIHGHNMSGNIRLMLNSAKLVLLRQKPHLRSNAEIEALANGMKVWRNYYADQLLQQIKSAPRKPLKDIAYLITLQPSILLRIFNRIKLS